LSREKYHISVVISTALTPPVFTTIMHVTMKQKVSTSLILILLISFIISGCNSSNNEYESITVENELCSYSLQYPSLYEKDIRDHLDFNIPYTYLVLEGPVTIQEAEVFDPDIGEIITVSGERGTSVISIKVLNYKVYYGESYSAADRMERVLEGQASWANFKLLNRSPLTVSGVQGELVEYLVDMLMPIPREDGKNLEYVCAVYFDYNELTWVIEAKCIQELREQVKADFDYIIQSFKIIR
jgi:hypothetical protein